MRFIGGKDNPYRIFTVMRPHPLVDRHYLWARWRSERTGWLAQAKKRSKPPKGQRGGWWNKLRVGSLEPPRRVIDPAVRYLPVTRQCNEIRRYRWKNKKFFFPWDTRRPIKQERKYAL